MSEVSGSRLVKCIAEILSPKSDSYRSGDIIPDPSKGKIIVNWYDYIACFFAGVFLANAVPHFVHGVSGDRFATPFASPGKGLSSPTVNVVWALFNLVVGYILFRAENVLSENYLVLVVFFAGIAVISTWLSVHFTKKHPN
jgi:hypothetical protein